MKFKCPACRERGVKWWRKTRVTPFRSIECDNCHTRLVMGHVAFWIMVILCTLLSYPGALVSLYLFLEFGPIAGLLLTLAMLVALVSPIYIMLPLREKKYPRI